MQIIEKLISDVRPYGKNPRNNDDAAEAVANSIQEFGFKVPIVIDRNGVIVTGHTRLKAAKLLGLEKVPCIIADDLSAEQVKAFRLADNKVSEKAQWNESLLSAELSDLLGFDMEQFGFEFEEPDLDLDQEEPEKENERQRTMREYCLALLNGLTVSGRYDMPVIKKTLHIPEGLIGFNYMLSSEDYKSGIHCFIDDYQFERLWTKPEAYTDKLRLFDCFLSPDFSLYSDMPMAMQLWNTYRSRLIGAYYQSQGIEVIPTVSWGSDRTFDFCFDGVEPGGVVAVSTIGVKQDEKAFQIWTEGMDVMQTELEPSTILVYGGEVEYTYNTEVIYFENQVTERMKKHD